MKGLGLAVLFGSVGASTLVAFSLLVSHLSPKPLVLAMAALIWAFLTAVTYLAGLLLIKATRLPSSAAFGLGGVVPIALLLGLSLLNPGTAAVPLLSSATVVALLLLWFFLVACSLLAFRMASSKEAR